MSTEATPTAKDAGPSTARIAEYLNTGGECLVCEHQQIEGDSFDVEATSVYQTITCLGCGASWVDTYTLSSVANIVLKDDE